MHREIRQQNAAIILTGKRRGRALHHADHFHLGSGDGNLLSNRLLMAEQRLVHVLADRRDGQMMLVFGLRKEAAVEHFGLAAIGVAGFRAVHLWAEIIVALVAHPSRKVPHAAVATGKKEGAGALHRGTAFGDRQGVVVGQWLAVTLLCSSTGKPGSHAHLEDHGSIGSHAADDASDRAVQARQNRTDGDDGPRPHDHAEHGEKGTNLVFAQRGQRQADDGKKQFHGL